MLRNTKWDIFYSSLIKTVSKRKTFQKCLKLNTKILKFILAKHRLE